MFRRPVLSIDGLMLFLARNQWKSKIMSILRVKSVFYFNSNFFNCMSYKPGSVSRYEVQKEAEIRIQIQRIRIQNTGIFILISRFQVNSHFIHKIDIVTGNFASYKYIQDLDFSQHEIFFAKI